VTHEGYSAQVEFDAVDGIFVARIADISDVISFHAATVVELERAFHDAVSDYVKACAELDQQPSKPITG
jgi:predicted HicB family RNase H-like nuclease